MADAASSVVNYFHGNMIFINVMKNMSVDCDCCEIAEDPCMADMGILVSTDPIAIDQACIDLVYGCDDPGKAHFLERVESRNGVHTIEAAAALGFGSREYTLDIVFSSAISITKLPGIIFSPLSSRYIRKNRDVVYPL